MLKTKKYAVEFEHVYFANPQPYPVFNKEGVLTQGEYFYKGKTICIIRKRNGEIARVGSAFCSVEDQFDKSVGRKVALTQALEPFKRKTRTKIWKKYWKARHGKK